MTKRILTLYPNCSLGGMTTVYRNRIARHPEHIFDFIFLHEHGGRGAFVCHPNADVRIVKKDRLGAYIAYVTKTIDYDEIRITSLPDIVSAIAQTSEAKLIYEFHSSDLNILSNEISQLDFSRIKEMWVPSRYLKGMIAPLLIADDANKLNVVPNLLDIDIFNPIGAVAPLCDIDSQARPLVWLGRLEKGKNYKDFLRTLRLLPDEYMGILIVSLEDKPGRMSEALYEINMLGVSGRVKILQNLPQEAIADIYRFASMKNGFLCSTSLSESFGYAVLEAAMAGLPVVAYDVGALNEHLRFQFGIQLTDVGDVYQLAESIRLADWHAMHLSNLIGRKQYLQRHQIKQHRCPELA